VPFLLKHSLRDYQHVGLDWLIRFYDQNLNCILADETGLGKTIQTIALLAYLACEKANWGPHLIIVPTNQMLNWQIEFKKWCPALKIFLDYGSIEDWINLNTFHVYITSNRLILQNSQFFQSNQWKYLIVDDIPVDFCQTLQSEHRLLLTNSPVQSRILMKFLFPNFDVSERFFQSQKFDSFILRRSKVNVEEQMPKKYEHTLICDLSKRQRIFYENLVPHHSIDLIIQLKKICNHPDLVEPRSVISPLILEKKLIKYEIPQLIFDINFKNPYFGFDCVSHDTFLSYRIQFTLQPTKEMIINRINTYSNDEDYNQIRLQLTKDIIERYRNTSIWTQTDNQTEMDLEFQSTDEEQLSRYELLCQINADRCQFRPLYGCDVLSQIELAMNPCHYFYRKTFSGYAVCRLTNTLRELVQFNHDILDR
jgi:E1A-binding protein p400